MQNIKLMVKTLENSDKKFAEYTLVARKRCVADRSSELGRGGLVRHDGAGGAELLLAPASIDGVGVAALSTTATSRD